jgi:mRNA interferase MazF
VELRRGDLVTVALQGAYGKPRPALVIQSDQFVGLGSVAILPVQADKIGPVFGRLDEATMVSVNRALAVFLGLAG